MTKKLYFSSVCLAITFTLNSCSSESGVNQTKQDHSFNVKAVDSGPTAVPTSGPSDVQTALANKPAPDSSFTYKPSTNMPDELPFIDYPNTELPSVSVRNYSKNKIVSGQIQVVLKDDYGLKINDNQTSTFKLVSTKNAVAVQHLNSVLANRRVQKVADMAKSMSEQQVNEDQESIKRQYRGHIPSRYSIQTYFFPIDTDLIEVAKELRDLPFVYSANLVYEAELSYSKQQLSNINTNAYPVNNPSAPSDPGFGQSETTWWWFNRHKVFDGWIQYGGTAMPTVAVIDSGFDTNAAAIDKPNYISGVSILNCTSLNQNCNFSYGLAAVVEPTHTSRDFSHGTQVASLVGSPKNNGSMLSGVAPNAPIYPIRIMRTDINNSYGTIDGGNLATAINFAKQQSSVDVISFSISNADKCASSMANNEVKTEISSAIASYGKIVTAAVGNNRLNMQSPPSGCGTTTGGEIIVGGLASDTVPFPNRTKGWGAEVSWPGSNYDSTTSTGSSVVDIAAAAQDIRVPWFDPNTGNRGEGYPYDPYPDGTSLATPIVAGTAGMVKKIAAASGLALSHVQVKAILLGTADMSRYSPGNITNLPENKFLGENMDSPYQYGTPIVGARSLNVNNAIVVAKNMKNYPIIVRLHNVDDSLEATINNDWTQKIDSTYGRDKIVGYKNVTAGSTLNFRTYNASGGYSYGYSLFKNNTFWWQNFAGVSGVSGAEGVSSKPAGYYGGYSLTL